MYFENFQFFDPFPEEMAIDTAFLDRMHCYLPGGRFLNLDLSILQMIGLLLIILHFENFARISMEIARQVLD